MIPELEGMFKPGTHCDLVLRILGDGAWHNVIDMMSVLDGPGHTCRNWAIRSRISDINKKIRLVEYTVLSRIATNRQGEYRMVRSPDMKDELFWKIWGHPRVSKEVRHKIDTRNFSHAEYEFILRQLDQKMNPKDKRGGGE